MSLKKRTKTRRHLTSIFSFLVCLAAGFAGGYQTSKHISPPPVIPLKDGSTQVRFSPNGGCTTMLTQAILQTKNTLEIAIFDLTSQEIADTIITLHKRGVQVRIVADRRQSKGQHSKLPLLHKHGLPIRIAKCSGLMHHKVSIIDKGQGGMLTGSFNYTFGAENKNKENLLWIKSISLAKVYSNEWEMLWSNAKPYTP